MDSPGVFFSNEDETTLLLRNTIKVENVQDLEGAVRTVVSLVSKEELMKIYHIDYFDDYKDFMIKVASIRGRLKKKGVLNLEETAKIVIQDWCRGKIPYYRAPPVQESFVEQNLIFGHN